MLKSIQWNILYHKITETNQTNKQNAYQVVKPTIWNMLYLKGKLREISVNNGKEDKKQKTKKSLLSRSVFALSLSFSPSQFSMI